MLFSLPSTLIALLFCSESVNGRPEPLAAQRRYLNTSAPAILPIAPPTTFLISDDLTQVPADYFPSAIASTFSSVGIDILPTPATSFTPGFAAPTTEVEDPKPTDDGLLETENGSTKTDEGEVKTEEGDAKTEKGESTMDDIIYITPQPYATSRSPFGNYTYTLSGTTTQTTSCTTRRSGEGSTVYIILPNPNTITITLGGNYTTSLPTQVAEFTPPVFCPTLAPAVTTRYTPPIISLSYSTVLIGITPTTTSRKGPGEGGGGPTGLPGPVGGGGPIGPTSWPIGSGSPVTTVITTSKNPVVTFTTVSPPSFPSNDGGGKVTILPPTLPVNEGSANGGGNNVNQPGNLPQGGPQKNGAENSPTNRPPQDNASNPPKNPPVSGVGTGGQGVPDFGSGDQKPIVTTVRGIEVEIDPTQAIIDGTTVRFVNPTQAAVANVNGGSNGNGGGGDGGANDSGAAPANNLAIPTNIVIIDGGIFSAVGSSVAVFDGRTIYYNNGATTTTEYHHEQITLGASITYGGTTMGGTDNIGTELGIAGGISVTQVGQSLAVISSISLTIGPQAVVTTVIIDQYTVIANTAGLEIDGTTLSHPFQPYTQYITVGDVTMTQIGTSLLVVEGTTYTIGGLSGSSSSVANRQSITIASWSAISTITSEGSTTPLRPSAVEPAPAASTSKKSGGTVLRPGYMILGVALGMVSSFYV